MSFNSDEHFFNHYLRDNTFDKVMIFREIIESDEFVEAYVKSLKKRGKNPITNLEAYRNNLKLEVHFRLFAGLENFFALLLGIRESPDNVWKWITSYNNWNFNKKINEIAEDGISDNDVKKIFFSRVSPEAFSIPKIEESIQKIPDLVKGCAEEFLGKKDEYNAFKHGGKILKVNLKHESEAKISDGISFLLSNGKMEVRPFNYERDFKIIELTWWLTRLIIDQRKSKNKEINMLDFSKLDSQEIFEEKFPFRFSLLEDK